jgi:hypothetical protein
MKLGKLKYALLALVLLSGVAEAQLYMKHPTDVRYIGGNMTNKRPYFKGLNASLNDVKALATSERPYVFWVISDTINVFDWDSVYNQGLSMRDSIQNHYIAEGKIKWGGFMIAGTGGGGGGSDIHAPPTNTTTHYDFYTWTGQTGLQVWQDRLGQNADSIDQRIWELIVYTDSTYLYIENDTLKIRTTTIQALIDASGVRPDTTIIAYKAIDETITGDWTFNGNLSMGTGDLRFSPANNTPGVSRVIWSSSNIPYWSGSGAVGDTSQVVLYDIDTGLLNLDSLITWNNLNQAVRDSLTQKWYIDFYENVSPAHSEGRVFYDTTSHTLSVYNDESEVTLNMGSELFIRVWNETGFTITNGSVVYPVGAYGVETPSIAKAKADVDATSNVIGMATHDIEDDTYGYITRYGFVHDVNTDGMTPGGTFYLSASTAGEFTTTKPGAPNNAIPLGGVTKVDISSGSVFLIMDRFNPVNAQASIGFIDSALVLDLAVGVPQIITNPTGTLFTFDTDVGHDISLSGDTLYLADPGVYNIVVAFSFQGANGGIYKFTAKEDGTFVERAGRRYTSTADVGNVYFNFVVATTTINEIVTFWLENTAGSQDATMIDASVIVTQVR